jgi:hypothetical protein
MALATSSVLKELDVSSNIDGRNAATGETATTTAARQLLRGRSPSRGEWEHIPCFFLESANVRSRVKNLSKKKHCTVSLLLRRDPESFSVAERREGAREASAFRFAILHQSFALIRLH